MRTDRKTGEPILSPRLSADQLHAMANDPGWRPWMRLIAEHPNAWPGLVDWWRTAQEQGFDTAGAAPEPPESMRGRRRVAIPAAPLPPENGAEPEAADPVGSTDGWESVPLASEEGLAADPAPSPPEPEEDAGRQSPDPDRREEWTGNGVLDRFLEDESLFGEFLRTPVSEGGVESLVVEPPHIVVEVGA